MLISTKGRYALRVMIDLAENSDQSYIPMKEIAERQEISLKYLEKIIPPLVKEGLIEGSSGRGGGYRLTKEPKEYTVGDILRITEGNLAPVACLRENAKPCSRADICKTLPVWIELDKRIKEYLDETTLESLL